jgi:hypothetical protein
MAAVFVSYSKSDRTCAFEIVQALESSGISVWVAPRDIAPSADWAEEILQAISNSRLMVLVFSAESNNSPQVRREVERAVHRDLPVLPFRIEDVLPTKSLEYFLSTQHWMDAFSPPRDAQYARLVAHISERLSAPISARQPAIASTEASSSGVDLQAIEGSLLDAVGPIARVLVQRALRLGLRGQALLEALAAEIDSPQTRGAFLARHALKA